MVPDPEKRGSSETQMNVIAFCGPKAKAAENNEPHLSGIMICAACKHEHIAVVPVGVALFECPNCHTHKAAMKYDCAPGEGTIWQCNCGCDLFRITERGAMCINCGKRQLF